MKWRAWSCSLLFVFSLLCVGGVIINQKNNASALSDLTYTSTYDGSSFSPIGYLCGGGSAPSCQGYSYILIELSSTINESFNVLYYNYSNFMFPKNSYFVLFKSASISSVSFGGLSKSGFTTGDTITYTISENNPFSSAPSGSLSITENGTYDVTNYAEAVVDVPVPEPEVIPGDYHDDLVSINNAILIVPAVALVVYFFYAIYKMLLGGKPL